MRFTRSAESAPIVIVKAAVRGPSFLRIVAKERRHQPPVERSSPAIASVITAARPSRRTLAYNAPPHVASSSRSSRPREVNSLMHRAPIGTIDDECAPNPMGPSVVGLCRSRPPAND